jgi:hypothetical protein
MARNAIKSGSGSRTFADSELRNTMPPNNAPRQNGRRSAESRRQSRSRQKARSKKREAKIAEQKVAQLAQCAIPAKPTVARETPNRLSVVEPSSEGTPISQSAPMHSHPDQTNAAAPPAGARPDVLAVEKPQPEIPAPPTRPPDYNQFCPRDPKLIAARLQDAKPIQAFPKDIESFQSESVRRFGPLPRRRH